MGYEKWPQNGRNEILDDGHNNNDEYWMMIMIMLMKIKK